MLNKIMLGFVAAAMLLASAAFVAGTAAPHTPPTPRAAQTVTTVPIGWAQDSHRHHPHAGRQDATASGELVRIPPAMEAEHSALMELMEAAAAAGGATGEAGREVKEHLMPHFEEENRVALPPLGLLAHLVKPDAGAGVEGGKPTEEMRPAIAMGKQVEEHLARFLEEHAAISRALDQLEKAAKAEGKTEHLEFVEHLRAHAHEEEVLLYPTTVIIGRYLELALGEVADHGAASAAIVAGAPRAPRAAQAPRAPIADGTYTIDPAHTFFTFSVRHLGINSVKGHFDEFAGTIVMHEGAIKEAQSTIQVKSIDTGVKQRDDHLRSADFFDAANHPVMTFKTRSVEKKADQIVLIADFTIRGVTKEVRLPVTLNGPIKDQEGKTRIGLEGKLVIKRKDYGINFNAVLESGVAMVGEEVSIEVNIEAVQQSEEN